MPVLIDFGGCQLIGTPLKYIRGTKGWIGGDIKDYAISDKQHDIAAFAKIGVWLDEVGLIIVSSPLSTPIILLRMNN